MEMENMEIMNEELNEKENEVYDFDEFEYEPEGPSMAAIGGTVLGIGAFGILGYVAGKKLAPKLKGKIASIKEEIADRKAMNAALKENRKAFIEAWRSKNESVEPVNDSEPDPETSEDE